MPPKDIPDHKLTYVAFPPRLLRNSVLIVIALFVLLQLTEWLFAKLSGFLITLLLAWLIAIAMEPGISWMTRRGVRRGIAAGVSLLGVIAVSAGFLVAFGGVLFAQIAELIRNLPTVTVNLVEWINATFDLTVDPNNLLDQIDPTAISDALGGVAGGVVGVVTALLGGLITILTMLFFTFYIAAEGPGLRRAIGSWLPHRQQQVFVRVWDITV